MVVGRGIFIVSCGICPCGAQTLWLCPTGTRVHGLQCMGPVLYPLTHGGGLVTKSCLTLATPWTIGRQAPPPEYWSGLPFPSPRDLLNPSLLLGLLLYRQILDQLSHLGSKEFPTLRRPTSGPGSIRGGESGPCVVCTAGLCWWFKVVVQKSSPKEA